MNHQLKIAPSLLACDFSNLESEVKNCEKYGADILHVDVMDGHFVPNITIGPLIVKSIKPHTSLPIDCHLMITNPDDYIDDFADAGADYISVHAEVCNHLHRTLTKIKERNCKAGIVLNPVTPLQFAYDAVFRETDIAPSFLLGAEIVPTELFAIRGGFNVYGEDNGTPKLFPVNIWGAGISLRPKLENAAFDLNIDYSVSNEYILGSGVTHHISLILDFK